MLAQNLLGDAVVESIPRVRDFQEEKKHDTAQLAKGVTKQRKTKAFYSCVKFR